MNIFTLKTQNVSHDAITLGLHATHRTQFSIVYSSVCVSVSSDILLTLTDIFLWCAASVRIPVVVLPYADTYALIMMAWMTDPPVTVLYVYTEYRYLWNEL